MRHNIEQNLLQPLTRDEIQKFREEMQNLLMKAQELVVKVQKMVTKAAEPE